MNAPRGDATNKSFNVLHDMPDVRACSAGEGLCIVQKPCGDNGSLIQYGDIEVQPLTQFSIGGHGIIETGLRNAKVREHDNGVVLD